MNVTAVANCFTKEVDPSSSLCETRCGVGKGVILEAADHMEN